MNRIYGAGIAAALLCASAVAQTAGVKLNHVVIAVRDLGEARSVYTGLGFSILDGGRHPGGTENSVARFSAGGYLELITPYDASLPDGSRLAKDLTKGNGPVGAGLEIASAEKSAHDLSAAGVKIRGPLPGTILRPGDKDPPPTRWWSILFADELPSRPLFLIQYTRTGPPLAAPLPNPNSSFALSALLIAVNDPEQAVAGYRNIGKVRDGAVELPEFGGVGREIVLNSGSILLLRATDPDGPTARRLKDRGEGILAVRMTVTDLDQARKQVGEKNVSKDKASVLVAPEHAAGMWLQFKGAQP